MNRCTIFILLAPYITSVTPPDSSYDEVQFGVGGGQSVYQDCSGGEHIDKFGDIGVRITHKFQAPYRIGATFSSFPIDHHTGVLIYPDLAVDYGFLSLGTTGARVGRIDSLYIELKAFDSAPFATGGGIYRCGISFPLSKKGTRLWAGANVSPYYNWGPAAAIDFKISDKQSIVINGRYGVYHQKPEFGLSLGLRWRDY